MILVKKLNFLHGLFLLKIGQEMMFGDLLDRKEALLDDKNMYLICQKKKRKRKEKEKKPFLTIKNCISYSRKTAYFPEELTNDFGQKFELSSLFVFFFFNRPRNDVWGCSR